MDLLFGEDDLTLPVKKCGKGHARTGQRKSWTKNDYFEQDLFTVLQADLGEQGFSKHFAGYKPKQILDFFIKIKSNLIRERETENHARNKLLFWIDRNHNAQYWHNIARQYKIGISTAKGYIKDVEKAIFKSFRNSKIINFPNAAQRLKMMQILKMRGVPLPHILFTLDDKHARCTGFQFIDRLSWKWKWKLLIHYRKSLGFCLCIQLG